jgi:hypothetical protein
MPTRHRTSLDLMDQALSGDAVLSKTAGPVRHATGGGGTARATTTARPGQAVATAVGFAGKCASAFGEREMKQFIAPTIRAAGQLRAALCGLDADAKIALTHYSPIAETLRGEPQEIHPFLGSYLLAEAIDEAGADFAVHGHAHFGSEQGLTPGGVRVRNVAAPVIQAAYRIYTWEPRTATDRDYETSGTG